MPSYGVWLGGIVRMHRNPQQVKTNKIIIQSSEFVVKICSAFGLEGPILQYPMVIGCKDLSWRFLQIAKPASRNTCHLKPTLYESEESI